MSSTNSLREQLMDSWQASKSLDEIEAITDMGRNLSEQVSYSNSLLKVVREGEVTNSILQQQNIVQEREITELRENVQLLHSKLADMDRELAAASSERDLLLNQNEILHKSVSTNIAVISERETENELLKQRLTQNMQSQSSLIQQISSLENTIASLHHAELEANRVGSSMNTRLKFENDNLLRDVEKYKETILNAQNCYDEIRDENISLKRQVERLLRANNDETVAKEEFNRRNKELTSQNVLMNSELQESIQQGVVLEQQVSQLSSAVRDYEQRYELCSEKLEARDRESRLLEVCAP
jgi:hypothetical protein